MTTIAAIRNNRTKDVVLAHDGRLSTTSHILCSETANKLIKFTHFALLWCGSAHLRDLLEHKHRKLFDNITIENQEDVLWFYQIYFDNVLNDPTTKAGDKGDESRHSADYIIITPDNVYWLNALWEFYWDSAWQSRYAEEISMFTAWGGWDIALNYMEWQLHHAEINDFTPEIMADILKDWCEYAGKRVISCNTNITLYKANDLFI